MRRLFRLALVTVIFVVAFEWLSALWGPGGAGRGAGPFDAALGGQRQVLDELEKDR